MFGVLDVVMFGLVVCVFVSAFEVWMCPCGVFGVCVLFMVLCLIGL